MMDVQSNDVDVDLEDGELSESADDEIYTPLQRPAVTPGTVVEKVANPLATCHQIQSALDESQTNSEFSSAESSEEGCLKKLRTDSNAISGGHRRRKQRTVMVRVPPTDTEMQPNRTRFKKYNVWTAALQEETLSENMRGCDVTRSGTDRNVENYDYSLKYRLNGENMLKRRLSNSSDEDSCHPAQKRGRPSTRIAEVTHPQRKFRNRIGHHRRFRRGTSSASGSSDNSCEPRCILDLSEIGARDASDVAREMASNLYEEKDELLVRAFEVLGMELPLELYKETQRIEADGGMMIRNGQRRRTPGGVFLFLLKHHDKITQEQIKSIFAEHLKNVNKSHEDIESLMRDRKVEELKKCLSEQSTELPTLNSRKELYVQGAESSAESQPGNLSNPPPSPVGQGQSSPEYKTHEININHVDNTEVPSTSKAASAAGFTNLVTYDDDFLDVTYADMDFF